MPDDNQKVHSASLYLRYVRLLHGYPESQFRFTPLTGHLFVDDFGSMLRDSRRCAFQPAHEEDRDSTNFPGSKTAFLTEQISSVRASIEGVRQRNAPSASEARVMK